MPLKTLVRIKLIKLQQAEREALKQQTRLQAARQAKEQADKAYLDYQQWRREEEQRLFEEHQGQLTDRCALEKWRRRVALLREEEAQHLQQTVESLEALKHQRKALQEAQKAFVKAQQQMDKFQQLHERAREEERCLDELKEELELEEHHSRDPMTA